jgi:hypothetical protein
MTMTKAKSQIAKFRETARALGADPSEERFNASLKSLGRRKPSPEPKHSAKPRGRTGKRGKVSGG